MRPRDLTQRGAGCLRQAAEQSGGAVVREQPVEDFCIINAKRCRDEDRCYLQVTTDIVNSSVSVLVAMDFIVACWASKEKG